MEIQLLWFSPGGLFLLDVPQFTSPHLFCLWCGGTSPWTSFISRNSILEATALEISSKSSFLLFIHLSATLAHEATWTLLESEHLNLNWKSSIQPIFGCLPSIRGGKKETKSKSLQTSVSKCADFQRQEEFNKKIKLIHVMDATWTVTSGCSGRKTLFSVYLFLF